jgi:hypothetical protein
MMTGVEVHAQIDALMGNQEGGFVGYGEKHMWTHKSGFMRLPYFDDLLLPHNINVITLKRMSLRHFRQQSWTFLISQRTMLRLDWIWQRYAIDQSKRCSLLEATRHGEGLRPNSS